MQPRPVQLMIVGAPKAGTTSLKQYLGQHPGVCTHEQREMLFFASEQGYEEGYARIFSRYFGGRNAGAGVVVGKSVALMYSADALDRLQAHNPDVHVVVLLRNPVDRAYSEYWYARRRGWENLDSFEDAIVADPARFARNPAFRSRCAYLDRSTYVRYVRNILDRFPKRQVHIFLVEELYDDAVAVCQQLFRLFPELDDGFTPYVRHRENAATRPRSERLLGVLASDATLPTPRRILRSVISPRVRQALRDKIQRLNEAPFDPPMLSPATRTRLAEYFAPFNQQLAELLGRDLSHWNGMSSTSVSAHTESLDARSVGVTIGDNPAVSG